VLEPGDILYLPPRFAHDGVAVGDDCMTYSVGFRAPSRAELIAAWCDEALQDTRETDRYGDAGLAAPQDNPGEITPEALARLHAMLTQSLNDAEGFARAFGKYATTPRYPDADWAPARPISLKRLRAATAVGAVVERNPASRFSYVVQGPETTLLFVDGQCLECGAETSALARALCAAPQMPLAPDMTGAGLELVQTLLNAGSLTLGE
jgi:50S ribosomal protein L16 3-hydroxylase